jgi:hypothetical protein
MEIKYKNRTQQAGGNMLTTQYGRQVEMQHKNTRQAGGNIS